MFHLLIAPEGIEINFRFKRLGYVFDLLIAPEGIEISLTVSLAFLYTSLNRTRRN
jgi:hypothetical protein